MKRFAPLLGLVFACRESNGDRVTPAATATTAVPTSSAVRIASSSACAPLSSASPAPKTEIPPPKIATRAEAEAFFAALKVDPPIYDLNFQAARYWSVAGAKLEGGALRDALDLTTRFDLCHYPSVEYEFDSPAERTKWTSSWATECLKQLHEKAAQSPTAATWSFRIDSDASQKLEPREGFVRVELSPGELSENNPPIPYLVFGQTSSCGGIRAVAVGLPSSWVLTMQADGHLVLALFKPGNVMPAVFDTILRAPSLRVEIAFRPGELAELAPCSAADAPHAIQAYVGTLYGLRVVAGNVPVTKWIPIGSPLGADEWQ